MTPSWFWALFDKVASPATPIPRDAPAADTPSSAAGNPSTVSPVDPGVSLPPAGPGPLPTVVAPRSVSGAQSDTDRDERRMT